jgi:hypothetical protein
MDSVNAYCINGMRIIRLSGTDLERAIQHGDEIGKLSKTERKTLATRPLATKNQSLLERAIRSQTIIPNIAKNAIVNGVLKAYEKTIITHHHNLDEKFTSRLADFARHSHLSPRELIFALYQPDFLMVLAALTSEKVKPHFLSGMPGCSSAVVRTGKEGGLTLLRNLDYPAAGHWEKWPTVFFHEPSETRYQNYISAGSLGIHLAGLTGVNESGVAFSLHAHFSKKFSLKGAPIFFLGQEILESARSIDEAIFICKSFRTIGSWAINLASEKENRAVTIELSDGKVFSREMSPDDLTHAHAKGFQCTEFKKNELHFSGSFFEDVESRKASLEEDLSVSSEEFLTLKEALGSLASHKDHQTGVPRIFGNSVSVVTTIQSLAIDLKNNQIHISAREETPTPLGPYLTIPTDWRKIPIALSHPIFTHLEHPFSQNFIDALHDYYNAYCSWHVLSESPQKTLEYLIKATEHLDNDPHLLMQRGYFELLISSTQGHYRAALKCFDHALAEQMSNHHQQVARYFRGVCLDLLNEHGRAIEEYEILASAGDIDSKLKKKAIKRLKNPFKSEYCQKLVPDLQFVEPLEYD